MGTFYGFVRKFMSFCGVRIEFQEEELREPLKDGLRTILDNSLSTDNSNWNARYENDGPNKSRWSCAEMGKGEMHSESSNACSQRNTLQFRSGINFDHYDSLEESESDLGPVKITKKASKQQNGLLAVEISKSLRSHTLSSDTTTNITSDANAVSGPSSRLLKNKADVHSWDMSIKEATLEELLSAFSGRNSLQSPCSTKYDGDDSFQEKLTRPLKTSSEPNSNPVKSKKMPSERERKKALQLSSLINQNEKPTLEPRAGGNKPRVYSSIKEVTSEELLAACSQRNSIQSPCGTNNVGDDSLKEKLTGLQKTSTEPDSNPPKSKKKAPKRASKKAMQLSSLINQNEKPTGEPATSSCSDHQGSNSITPLRIDSNAVSVPNAQQLRSRENGCMLAEIDSSANLLESQKKQLVPQKKNYDDADDDSSKGVIIGPHNRNTESDSRPGKSKKRRQRGRKRKAMRLFLRNIQSEQLSGESSKSSDSIEQADSLIFYEADGSLKEKHSSPRRIITEPDSRPLENKKRAARRQRKALTASLLNNQNEHVRGESPISSHSDHLRSNSIEPASDKGNDTSVPSSQGSGENADVLSETNSSKDILTCLKNGITEPDSTPVKRKKKASKCKGKKNCLLDTQNGQLIVEALTPNPHSLNTVEQISNKASAISVPNSQLVGSENGRILIEPDSLPSVLGSKKTLPLVPKKVTSDIGANKKELKLWMAKEESSPKMSSFVNGTANAACKKLSKQHQSEFSSAADEQESPISSHSDLLRSNSFEPASDKGNDTSVPRSQGSGENADVLAETNSSKDILTCLKNGITEPDSTPVKSKKKASKCKGKKNGLLDNQNGQLIVEALTPNPHSLNAVEQISNKAIAISVPNSQLVGSENGRIVIEPDSLPSVMGSKKTLPLVPKKVTSDIGANKKEVKLCVAKEKSSPKTSSFVNGSANAACKKLSKQHQSEFSSAADEQESPISSHSDLLISNSFEPASNKGIDTSVPSSQGSGENADVLAETNSSKDILTCLKNGITEPDSTPVKSKKKASKCKGKKNCLLDNQNGQLIVEALTPNPHSLNTVEQISNKVIAISVPNSQLVGSENGRILIEPVSLPSVLGSKKTLPLVPKKLTSDIGANKKGVKLCVAKKESSSRTSSFINGSVNAACKKLSKQDQSEFSSAADEQESGYIQQLPEGNTNTSMKTQPVLKRQHQQSKKRSSCGCPERNLVAHTTLFQLNSQQNLVSKLKKPFMVNGCTYDDALKKMTLVEFNAVPEEQEPPYFGNSLKGSNGSKTSKKVITSPTNAVVVVERKIQDYCSSHKILLVGEGNFSFSACLARAFDYATNMVATSLNSEEYLNCYYKGAMDNISELQRRGCKILHEVDATTVADHCSINGQSFDRIIYNFPHCGDFSLTKNALRKNQKLVRLFMVNSSKMIEPDGEIHIRHKTTKSFAEWDLKGLAAEAGLVLIEEARFQFLKFKGYETKYGFEGVKLSSDYNFNCHPCRTYKFALPRHQKEMGRQNSKLNAL